MEVELFDAFTSNDDKIIGRKESLVFDQNMAYQANLTQEIGYFLRIVRRKGRV